MKTIGKIIKIIFIVFVALIVLGIVFGRGKDAKETPVATTNPGTENTTVAEQEKTEEVEPSYSQETILFDVYTNSIGKPTYDAIVQVTNTGNCPLYLGNATFDVEDTNGHLIGTDEYTIYSCPKVIDVGEVGYFYTSFSSSLPDGTDTNAEYQLVPTLQIKSATGSITEYVVSDTSLSTSGYWPEVTGRIENTTDKDDSYVYVQCIFYDASGNVIGIAGTSVTDLTAGSKKSFDLSAIGLYNSATKDQIADYKVYARKSYFQF